VIKDPTKKYRDIDTLKFDPKNARAHDERNIQAIMDSLTMSQQRKPVVIYSDMIIAGNGTVTAAKRLGWTEVWVNDDPFESLDAAKAYAVTDNRTGELATWIEDRLDDTLTELMEKGYDLKQLGFDKKPGDLEPDENEDKKVKELDEFCMYVTCANETDLRDLFEELTSRGIEVKLT
jgi:ParB-like chromosome segregation protein Spo0J